MTWRTKKRNLTSENSTARPGENLCLPNFQPRMDANKREYSQTSWGQTSWGRESFHSVIPEIPATVKQFLFNTIYHHAEKTPDPLVESLGWVPWLSSPRNIWRIDEGVLQDTELSCSSEDGRLIVRKTQDLPGSPTVSGRCVERLFWKMSGRQNELCCFEIEMLE